MALQGKVAIITGSSSGLGAAIAECFVKEGAKVCITGRRQEQLDSVAKKCQELSGGSTDVTLTVKGDIAQKNIREDLVQKTIQKFGKIDILVNNAGINRICPVTEETEEEYDLLMAVNLKAPVFLTQIAVPYLKTTRGVVINVSSIASFRPGGVPVYAMTKAGIDMLTKALAKELGPFGVRAISVTPGFIADTEILRESESKVTQFSELFKARVPLGRNGTPEEVGKSVVFLASDKASFISGQSVILDGGLLANV